MYVLISGGFDPIHSGHIKMFREASYIGKVIVAVNSDIYLLRKKGTFILPQTERVNVLRQIKTVEQAFYIDDDQDGSALEALKHFASSYYNGPKFFVNGGDQVAENANPLEVAFCKENGIHMLFGLGGTKSASSSNFYTDSIRRLGKDNLLKLLN